MSFSFLQGTPVKCGKSEVIFDRRVCGPGRLRTFPGRPSGVRATECKFGQSQIEICIREGRIGSDGATIVTYCARIGALSE